MTSGRNHEIASLLLTESIQYATKTLKRPLWVIFIDTQSAFDSALKEYVIPSAFLAAKEQGQVDQSLIYLANRLSNRHSFLEYDKIIMGPTMAKAGVYSVMMSTNSSITGS